MTDVVSRRCTKPACDSRAVATLTYIYADSTAVLGPLATYAEPHCYDLCEAHSRNLTVPMGWEVVRLELGESPATPTQDDIEALANAVREVGRAPLSGEPETLPPRTVEVARRGHLRVLRDGGAEPTQA